MSATVSSPRIWPTSPAKHQERYKGQGLWLDKTIYDWSLERAAAHPDVTAFPGLPQIATYASLLADAEALGASLWDLDIRPGDVISFQTPNWVEACVINLAAALCGFVINPIVTIYRDAEVKMMLADSASKAIFIAETYRKFDYLDMMRRLKPSLPDLQNTILVRSAAAEGTLGYEDLIRAGKGRKAPAPRVDPNAIKLLLYTSGTTGRPKGVLHSHNSLARATLAGVAHWGIKEGDAILMPSPVTHVSGYSNGLELPFLAGTRTVLMEAWNADAAVELIDKHQVASTVAATPFLAELVNSAQRAGSRLSSFVSFACGGAAVPPDIVRNANRDFGRLVAFRV
ncbi:MAG: AMP-binding protein, partial [Caulobacterales bacterium]